jgi:hypothetical protein
MKKIKKFAKTLDKPLIEWYNRIKEQGKPRFRTTLPKRRTKMETKYVYSYQGEFISDEEALERASDTTVIGNDGKLVKLKYFSTIYVFDKWDDWNGYEYALEWIIDEDGDIVRLDAQYHRSAYEVLRVEYELSDEDCESPIGSECIGYYII